MTSSFPESFKQNYQSHLQHLKLKGLQPKTIDAYSRAIRRIGLAFDYRIDNLSRQQLLNYFTDLLRTHSWSAVKLDLYGLKFYTRYVLDQPWEHLDLIKPPKAKRLPDILTAAEVQQLIDATCKLSYKVFFFTLYSLGLRLSEGLALTPGDIDGKRMRTHIRDSKGNKDRYVPLPQATYLLLRCFWAVHRNPNWLFPNRKSGLKGSTAATTPLDRGGVQTTFKKVANECGFKKRFPRTACVTAMPRIYWNPA
ncbi:Site-specific recombinase XerD [Nitrosomonas sp. Nm51]|nr:site-specific integrase [Nitrosomonas sp. Nm51]SER85381.1 Site-specific recombinase XerD [Nitrosomonas sp. Nm51]